MNATTRKKEELFEKVKREVEFHKHDFDWEDWQKQVLQTCVEDEQELEEQNKWEKESASHWNKMYAQHSNKMYPMKNYIKKAFSPLDKNNSENCNILECGAGTGAALFPLVHEYAQQGWKFFAFDFSSKAVAILKTQVSQLPLSIPSDSISCFEYDLTCTEPKLEELLQQQKMDFCILCFVLSAIPPQFMKHALEQLKNCLKISGKILFRDYGLYDFTQLQIDSNRKFGSNYYIRCDNTLVYYFSKEAFQNLVHQIPGLQIEELEYHTVKLSNKKTKEEMHRVFLNAIITRVD